MIDIKIFTDGAGGGVAKGVGKGRPGGIIHSEK